MDLKLECEREIDGRWLAEVSELPGVLAYGSSTAEAMTKAEALAFRVFAERLEHGEVCSIAANSTEAWRWFNKPTTGV